MLEGDFKENLKRKSIQSPVMIKSKMVGLACALLVHHMLRSIIFVRKLKIIKGPKSTQVVQYFTCNKFPDVAQIPGAKKGYCFSMPVSCCITKYRQEHPGKYQRDYIYKHRSHEKNLTKKHALLCHEHRGNSEYK